MQIVTVKYEDEYCAKTFSGREYIYYTSIPLNVGDLVEAPTKYGTSVARVSSINVPEDKISSFKESVRTIKVKLNKELFLNDSILEPAV